MARATAPLALNLERDLTGELTPENLKPRH